ncbi:lipid II:glycine glycyltransferase FemX [Leptospira santarosai]|uniref:Glycosyltransferase n=1 Tax=Leptospira santarosai TaxID=28183 RepID=A0AB73LLG3_9LEPT|nr:peptidoglycan bridge formation glycyltransferase FemA/FemB family protein [Leptospira santarosai]AVV50072.1 FemAB domain protein [Leptospira santarosai]EPG82633.1 FemAB domain protein [Leptospira santarosai serovar Shermani str. 1342KT]MDI7217549.1 peptidoglycan bridge formation glycyltransferase FemA/FemB family protein [Leptospira santarosai]ONF91979.1 glycosyltransferase [Leptospira santarosai]UZN08579.1 peptidoglycan bridge formation glycyltransferase FemA/FemB family protein [Leptospir
MHLLAPLPSWRNLFSVLSFKNIDKKSISKIWTTASSDISLWFSKSAWSLLVVAVWKRMHSDRQAITFWLPDYFCNSSLFLLRSWGVKFVFYPIQKNREPDYRVCKELLKSNPIDVFVLVHYFGKPSDSNRAFEFCKGKDVILIEDATHVLKPTKGIGEKGDFVLYSPHKHLPIPDGAILVVRNSGPSNIFWDIQDEDHINRILNTHYEKVGNMKFFSIKWLLKRLLQKLGFRSRRSFNAEFLNDVSAQIVPHPFFSLFAKKILNGLLPQLNGMAKQKIRIQKVWDEILSNRYKFYTDRTSGNWIPYLSEYCFDGMDAVKSMFKILSKDGLPVSTWPDLPPEIRDEPQFHLNAIELRNSRLFLSIHPNLSLREMLGNEVVLHNAEKDFLKLDVEWNSVSRETWDELFKKVAVSNFLQSWVYGESKKICENWKVHRGVFTFENQKIALVQILEKSILGIFKVYRINRGPLFLNEVDLNLKELVFKKIAEFGNLLKGSVLFFNPEVVLGGKFLILMKENGFYENNNFSPWTSAFIDLTKDLNFLRQNLDSKWRNMLTNSEKNDLTLEIGSSDFLFHWMLDKYDELTSSKNFSGISKSMLLQIKEDRNGNGTFLILRAIYQNEFVAGVCIAIHGSSATYLIGWNGDLGRKLRANHFLLWNSIVQLKQMGCVSFDLGGIDQERTPGIAEFKLGVNGDNYELPGEFWKI